MIYFTNMTLETIFYIIILIYSIILHEITHAVVADREGDKTARMAGRITLNPIPHIDLFGSIIVPILSFLSFGGFMGWAKGVPYNPNNLHHPKTGEAKVAVAGVFLNFIIGTSFALLYRFFVSVGLSDFADIALMISFVNISLCFFNLLPIPPFDGARIILAFFPGAAKKFLYFIDRNGAVFLILALLLASYIWKFIAPLVSSYITLIAGM
jgi:Zn-dependent protease